MPPKYKKISVPNFPYQVFTQVWDSTGKRSNIQQPTQVISSIADYKPKDGKAPNDGSPVYTTVFDSSTKTFYQVPIYSGFDAVAQEIEEAEPAPTQEATPVQSTTAGVRAKSQNTKKRLPISSMPANAQQYVDHVDENGNVFFRLPEGVTNEQFQEALQRVQPQTTSAPLYETTPTQNSDNSQNNNSSGEATKSGNPNVRKTEGTPVQTGARYNLYAYPQRQVDVYNIHPDVYAQVLEQLNTQNGGGSQNNRYLVSTTPLSVPNGMANDSTYHYIGNDFSDLKIDIPADKNIAYFNGQSTVYIKPNISLNDQDVIDNKVVGKVVNDYSSVDQGRSNGHDFVTIPQKSDPSVKTTIAGTSSYNQPHITAADFRGNGSPLTAEQQMSAANNLYRGINYDTRVQTGQATASEIINSIPAENALSAEEEQRGRRNAFQRIGDFFGFHKEGGSINYFQYLQDGGEVEEKRGLARFVDHEKTDTSPREFDNAPSAKEIASGLAYMIPGYGTYLSIKDAVADPTWFNIGSAALSGLGDLAMLTGFGIAGKALVAGNRALRTAKFAKAADKGLQAGRAMSQIEDGKKLIKTTELAGLPKGALNIATHGEGKFELGGEIDYFGFLKSGGSIHIKPENKGKFTETKKRTGKTTEELTHSKNPITRKRAIFAQNAKKWNHKK